MTLPLTPQPDHPMETPTAKETTSTQLFGVLYITLTGMVDSMVLTSRPWSLLRQSMSYIIKLAPILWWALPAGLFQPHPELPNASTYTWFPEKNKKPFVFYLYIIRMGILVKVWDALGVNVKMDKAYQHLDWKKISPGYSSIKQII
ncbi:hypothetical protein DSO57_1006559 [Entomophthora muscae]|uniref:Uncharacterized protein n=1 Tax=Entomophthora muscae TaxID=34485 RepID=A0ACC2RYQ8_9FUNG|nr:hypothetical protein DSO57_1006559 [Entomophthora muscae]